MIRTNRSLHRPTLRTQTRRSRSATRRLQRLLLTKRLLTAKLADRKEPKGGAICPLFPKGAVMAAKKKAKKIVVKRVQKIDPDKHVIELEVHGASDPPIPLPLDVPIDDETKTSGFWEWLKSL